MVQLQKQGPPRRQPRQRRRKKSTPNGDVVNFSISVNEQWEDEDGAEHKNTDWFQIQVWGPLAKFGATLKAGTQMIVLGKIKSET